MPTIDRVIIDPTNLSNLLLLLLNKQETKSNNEIRLSQPYISSSFEIINNNNKNNDNDNDNVVVSHGRGLVATQDIAAGECLFVIPATLNVDVQTAIDEYQETKSDVDNDDANSNSNSKLLESIAESLLLQSMQDEPFRATLMRTLVGGGDGDDDTAVLGGDCPTIRDLLVGIVEDTNNDNDKEKDDTTTTTTTTTTDPTVDLDDILLNIIRRNAFGPDFVTYSKIVADLEKHANNNNNNSTSTSTTTSRYNPSRILGLYPLAAMLNHSCHPNVVRVYKQSIMIAHASEPIQKGQELVWSYIPPTTPFPQRQDILKQQHGFTCHCTRCNVERPVWGEKNLSLSSSSTLSMIQNFNDNGQNVQQLEDTILGNASNKELTNEAKRYVRMGFCQTSYIPFLNNAATAAAAAAVGSSSGNGGGGVMDDEWLLHLCTQLHFTFCACNNASTEHLSILFFCYDLIAKMHSTSITATNNSGGGGCIQKVRFWTEQLKKACMIRYGTMGSDLESVRAVMQHGKRVLRTVDGLRHSTYNDFI